MNIWIRIGLRTLWSIQSVLYGYGALYGYGIVWYGVVMTWKLLGRIYVINENINIQIFINKILQSQFKLSAIIFMIMKIYISTGFSSMSCCRCVQKDNHILVLKWHGNWPDLNQIKNLRSRLKKKFAQKWNDNKIHLIAAIILLLLSH